MELWIRSQNKDKLIKVEELFIKCTCEEMPDAGEYIIYDGWDTWLGKYATKERALEILDKIQEWIKYNVGLKFEDIVYEMPEE